MRGSCEEGRMELNMGGRGAVDRMALCMFWKSEAPDIKAVCSQKCEIDGISAF